MFGWSDGVVNLSQLNTRNPASLATNTGLLTERLWLERTRLMTDDKSSSPPNAIPLTAPKSRSIDDLVRDGFYRYVDTSGDCWVWTKSKNNWGYGQARIIGVSVTAHRLSWTLEHGPIPAGLLVLHKCDNRACVRPDHLFLGTAQDNSDDMIRKGRQLHRNTKLTADTVRAIRRRYADGGVSTIQLAKEYGIGVTTVAHLIHRRNWAWLDDEVAS